jgi:hypothetical protein
MMKVLGAVSAILALSAAPALAATGVDVSSPYGSDTFSCLAGQGMSFAIVRAWQVLTLHYFWLYSFARRCRVAVMWRLSRT